MYVRLWIRYRRRYSQAMALRSLPIHTDPLGGHKYRPAPQSPISPRSPDASPRSGQCLTVEWTTNSLKLSNLLTRIFYREMRVPRPPACLVKFSERRNCVKFKNAFSRRNTHFRKKSVFGHRNMHFGTSSGRWRARFYSKRSWLLTHSHDTDTQIFFWCEIKYFFGVKKH